MAFLSSDKEGRGSSSLLSRSIPIIDRGICKATVTRTSVRIEVLIRNLNKGIQMESFQILGTVNSLDIFPTQCHLGLDLKKADARYF